MNTMHMSQPKTPVIRIILTPYSLLYTKTCGMSIIIIDVAITYNCH